MSDSVWRWMTGCVYGECENCGEALWNDHEMIVTRREQNYHLRCLLDQVTNSNPTCVPTSFAMYWLSELRTRHHPAPRRSGRAVPLGCQESTNSQAAGSGSAQSRCGFRRCSVKEAGCGGSLRAMWRTVPCLSASIRKRYLTPSYSASSCSMQSCARYMRTCWRKTCLHFGSTSCEASRSHGFLRGPSSSLTPRTECSRAAKPLSFNSKSAMRPSRSRRVAR